MPDSSAIRGAPATVLPNIVERHADEVAILWHARDLAVRSPAYDLRALCQLDDRLDANLDGLRLAGDFGWEICRAALAMPEGGEVFAAMVLALERRDGPAVANLLLPALRSRERARAVVSALGWVSFARAEPVVRELLAADSMPELRGFGIAGAAAHGHDPGPPLRDAMSAQDPAVRARALRAAGELGRVDLSPDLRRALGDTDASCRFWAARSAAVLGEPAAGEVLWQIAQEGGVLAERACDMAARVTPRDTARARIRSFPADGARTALIGAAALGDTALVPWVIDCTAQPAEARRAGWALAMITGVDVRALSPASEAPAGFHAGPTDRPDDDRVSMDPDAPLPWPDPIALRQWWEREAGSFPSDQRLLRGAPVEPAWLDRLIRAERQPTRAAAAVELQIGQPGRPCFDVRAPGWRQRRALAGTSPARA